MPVSTATPRILTLGYEGLTAEAYVEKLISNGVRALVDVRKNAVSRKPGFSKKALATRMEEHGIVYHHLPELGIPSEQRQGLNMAVPATYTALFDLYRTEILPSAAEAVQTVKDIVREFSCVAITCFEADHTYCHRDVLTKTIEEDEEFSISVTHL